MKFPGKDLEFSEMNHIPQWLDNCYTHWKKKTKLLTRFLVLLVWLPSVFQLLQHFIEPKLQSQQVFSFHQIRSAIQLLLPFVCMLVALAVATSAASCYAYPPEVLLTTSKQRAYNFLRSAVRRTSLKWIIGLMLLPTFVFNLLFFAPILPSILDGTSESGLLWGVLYILLMIATIPWMGIELAQFIVLRFSQMPVAWKVIGVEMAAIVFIVLLWIWYVFLDYIQALPNWIVILNDWISTVLPFGIAIYMMLATRKPTKAMLEQL